MDTRFVESLIAVADHGSIVAAARAQALTPAAVSQRIQVLERDLGVALLTRRANAADPTMACRDLLPDLRRLVALADGLHRRVDPALAEGVLRLGAISTMLTALIPDLLRALQTVAPALEMRIEPGSSAALYQRVVEGVLDAALIVSPPFDPPAPFQQRTIRHEPLRLIAPPGRQGLAAVLRDLPLVAYDPRSWGGQIGQRYLRDHDLSPRRLCELDSLETIVDLVASGIGWSLVPHWPGLTGGQPLHDGHLYQRRIVLLTPAAPTRPALQRALLDAMGQVVG
ncbi:LysR family transcriptional regulator [Paracoccus nototheniae]|uniref:LysR family transcriptional regulator n=1 Tax=Paracoccus nototheniae TaxID=2489002 RepID=A0ABW4E1P7_9RHOB|nr:LysR family transcriptional regulator [Paracoccus nototheniae]